MNLDNAEVRQALYCVAEEHRARANGKPPGVQPWLTDLLRRLQLEAAVSQPGHHYGCDEPSLETWISSRQAAAQLGLSKRQTQRLSASLGARIVDGRWIYPQSAVTDYATGRHDDRSSA